MADEPLPNGSAAPEQAAPAPAAERPLSIREVAEQVYSDLENSTAEDTGNVEGEAPGTKESGSGRDPATGRFTAKSGEQSTQVDPALKTEPSSTTQQPQQPAAPASSTEAPANWSVEDRAMFSKLPQEAQGFLLKRHKDMEADYTQKTQANAAAITFAGEIAQIFVDPQMQAVMVSVDGQQISPQWAVSQWAAMHRRAMDPNPQVRAELLRDMAQRLKVDPAAVFGKATAPGELSEQDLNDPAIRYFADKLGGTLSDVQALRAELQAIRNQDQERQTTEAVKHSRQAIDAFADEKDAAGNLLRPHFDAVLPEIMNLFRADPNITIAQAYENATWMNPTVRQTLLAAQQNSATQQQANARAQQAARSNIRGKTSPVTKPDSGEQPKGLRATIAAAAEEVGF